MLLSVAMPIYNADKYLDESISSVMYQSMNDLELILVDDGSSDRSASICKKWAIQYPNKIKFIEKKNSGSLLTRRTCLQETSGQYIYIMDADDYLLDPYLFEKAILMLTKSDADLMFFNCTCNEHTLIPYFAYPFKDGQIFENNSLNLLYELILKSTSFNQLWNKIFRRTLVDWDTDYSRYKSVTNGTDLFQLVPIFSNAKKIIYMNKIGYFYRVNQNNLSIIHTFRPTLYFSIRENHLRLCIYTKLWKYCNFDLNNILKQRFMSSVASAVYKVRLFSDRDNLKRQEYLRSIGEDTVFRENYTLRNVPLTKKAIILLLFCKKYTLLNWLIKILQYKRCDH